MIFIDLDNTLIDFTGTARKFGIELAPGDFASWRWCEPSRCANSHNCSLEIEGQGRMCELPTPKEFYAVAELQPWFTSLIMKFAPERKITFMTKDYLEIKRKMILRSIELLRDYCDSCQWFEAADKSIRCTGKHDILIDDNPCECEAWRAKGGTAFWWDVGKPGIFGEFKNWWMMVTITSAEEKLNSKEV